MGSEPSGEFHRIRRLPPYVFAEVNTAKAKARIEQAWRGCDALNGWLGAHVGPSEMPPPERDVR